GEGDGEPGGGAGGGTGEGDGEGPGVGGGAGTGYGGSPRSGGGRTWAFSTRVTRLEQRRTERGIIRSRTSGGGGRQALGRHRQHSQPARTHGSPSASARHRLPLGRTGA